MSSWANSGLDFHLELAGHGKSSLVTALRQAVRSGRLQPGATLPPSRALALDLGMARNTVAAAYSDLVAEGWFEARQGSGTRVARVPSPDAAPARPPSHVRTALMSLVPGATDPATFPRTAWSASARRALSRAPDSAFGPGDPRGRPELRRALAEYLARARGVRVHPDTVVVCPGSGHGLQVLAQALDAPTIGVEEYGLHLHRRLLERAGVATTALELDEHGARPPTGSPAPAAVLLTPAHQFPLGGPLHPTRRTAFLEWASSTGGLVVEDDYDGEFRYDRRPVGAVQGLAPDRVAYLGTIGKSVTPALRIGWMVLPERLLDPVLAIKGPYERWVSATDQLTLADFIDTGGLDRHVRAMRQRYRRRRQRLVDSLAAHVPHAQVTGVAAGLHAVVELPHGTEDLAVERARRAGLALVGARLYRHPAARSPHRDAVVIGYATPPQSRFEATLDTLCTVLSDVG
ncbi:PLP-dependent aminotransferase family protein [Rhodococcus triatomae]|uniref:GntR family transcriptional regulator / MocR family aminotransferase n=1 Tax=Rhodococcus triatomae TaxID=300028 RepID=A0A1G8GHH7_9NOCA|nr:PLP-dependent aminotransferase family protein [Rhodococcus triatomae]QNG20376.1 PLP-dependent aminotransferase family protein [Rhodococcus triatomae]QNG23708.1 PLP-dependent aminotransferase family protein [Rhodococcus triatomae]SDH93835.1 GntR family transcriptional regulator / MocR family aminotransferase [Rhodococcus triatomae]